MSHSVVVADPSVVDGSNHDHPVAQGMAEDHPGDLKDCPICEGRLRAGELDDHAARHLKHLKGEGPDPAKWIRDQKRKRERNR